MLKRTKFIDNLKDVGGKGHGRTRVNEYELMALTRIAEYEKMNANEALRLSIREAAKSRGIWESVVTMESADEQRQPA